VSTPQHVLVLCGSRSPEVFEAVERRGLPVVVLSARKPIEPTWLLEAVVHPPVVVHAEPLEPRDQRGAARQILRLHSTYDFAAIVPVMEYGLLPAALAATELKLPTSSIRAVQNTRDKLRMRRVLEMAGLGQVRYAHCRSLLEAERFWRQIGGPIFMKPAAGSGSDGVSRIAESGDLQGAWELAANAPGFAGALCEEFIAGPELSLEGYSVDGMFMPIALTDKFTDSRFLELGHSQPARRTPGEYRSVYEFAARALSALGVTNAVSHTELKLTPAGPVLIETHTRMGGGELHQLTERTTGVDLADLTVALAFGEKPVIAPCDTGVAAAIRFMPGRAGVVASVELPAIEEGSGIVAAVAHVRPGDATTAHSSSFTRLGYALAVGATPEHAVARAEQCLAQFRIAFADDTSTGETIAAA
jgi:biotin carboxylase